MKKISSIIALLVALSASIIAAGCSSSDFIVFFDTDFGSSVPAQRTVDGKISEPSAPTRENYTFGGWFKNKELTEPFSFDQTIDSDITVYAKWDRADVAQTFKVYFHENGGSSVNDAEVTEGGRVSEPAVPTREGYVFCGWYTDDAFNVLYSFDSAVTRELHLFAKWESAVSVREKDGLLYREIENSFFIVSAKEGYAFGENVTIPSEFEGLPVSAVGSMRSLNAKKVVVEGNVTVAADAFASNPSVEIVEFEGFPVIGDRAFYMSALKVVRLGGAISIGESAFEQTQLVTVMIPATTASIGKSAFASIATLQEVGFAGDLPAFTAGTFPSQAIDYHIAQSALDKLAAGVPEEQKQEKIEEMLSGLGLMGGLYNLNETELKESLAAEGLYHGDAEIYIGMGTNAVITTAAGTFSTELYSYESVFAFHDDGSREVYKLDVAAKSNKLLTANGRGEVVDGDTLYDYIGRTLVYQVPESITRVAPGAGINNSVLRILSFGDSTTEIGSFAFSNGYLISVSFGAVETIGEYAFFGQNTLLSEVIFRSEKIPEVQEGAFCYFSGTMIVSAILSGDMTLRYGQPVYIWTPIASYSTDDFAAAFTKSLENFVYENENGEPVTQSYSWRNFQQLKTSGALAKGETYTTEYGEIEMTGTESGYALARKYDGNGNIAKEGYVYLSVLPGYSGDEAARHFTFYWGWNASTGMTTEDFYGTLNTAEKTVTPRGAEAGAYGDVNAAVIRFDGYKEAIYDWNGATYFGSYTVQGQAITITGIDGLATATYDPSTNTVILNGRTLEAIGDEAGTYRDIANRASVTLDGIPYTESKTEGEQTTTYHYDGKLTLTYKGVTTVTGYFLTGTKIEFELNGEMKDWTYSRTSEDPISGYYGDYSDMLQFKFVQAKGAASYTNGSETLVLDGYYSATLNGKAYSYIAFEDLQSVFLLDESGETKVVKLSEDIFIYSEAAEAGMYYVGSGENYRLYLDGDGQLIYFDGENKYGSYEYDELTNVFHTDIGSEVTAVGLDGTLDLERGVGYFVYNYYSATYAALSRTPFFSEKTYANAYAYTLDGAEVKNTYLSFTLLRTAQFAFINISGQPFAIAELSGFEVNDSFEIVCRKDETEYTVKFVKTEKEIYAYVRHNGLDEIIKTDSGVYQFVWLDPDKNMVAITMLMQYPSTVLAGEINWLDSARTSFNYENLDMSSGDYKEIKLTGYGTQNVSLNIKNSGASWYDSSSGAEYKYYKINVYSEDKLWVSNGNVGGDAKPEIAEYTQKELDGTTYYIFTSKATGKVVRFHFNGTSFVVDSETDA